MPKPRATRKAQLEALKKEIESRKDTAKATLITAYLTAGEDGETFTEKKKYNHKNKFAWGIEVMSEMLEIIDDSEGGNIIKDKIQEGINNSEDHIGNGLVRFFPGSGGVVEYRYTDIEFTDSDHLIYKSQVASDTLKVIEQLIEEFTKESSVEQDLNEEVEEVE